jgi:hypothetical protein
MEDSSEFIPELSIQDSFIDRDTLVAAMQVRVLDLLQHQPDLLSVIYIDWMYWNIKYRLRWPREKM